ncbi:uncharacterized protein LOC120486549 [Pimephales promelas]|uniref:uncharacterized protein LOC120486549 n=1 Tax=Pimephales promelas TaxID=90988 RepID=UPI001955DD12|nr:uncharacterized protein LOC120486549 [Pimephales promelas]
MQVRLLMRCARWLLLLLLRETGEDTFKLFTVKQELEYVEKQIRGLLVKQAELLDRRSTLKTSRADAHKSVVSDVNSLTPTSSTPCVPLPRRTRSSRASFTPAPKQQHGPWITQRKTRDRTRATSPPLGAVVLHAGANDIRLQQTEVLKKDYRSLIETDRARLYRAEGLHPSRIGAAVLSDNISKTLRTR